MRAGAHRASQPPRENTGHGTWLLTAAAWLLTAAAWLLLVLAAAQGYVSYRAQYTFINHAKHVGLPSNLEALGLDTGAVIFALLALSLARRGRQAAVERVLNVACAIGSLAMNLLAADLNSPRSITVWVMPSALYALASDRLIAVVRRWVLSSESGSDTADQASPWQAIGGLALWLLRLALDLTGTVAGFRRWVLVTAPVAPGVRAELPSADHPLMFPGRDQSAPGDGQFHDLERPVAGPAIQQQARPSPGQPAGDAPSDLVPGEKKREALIRLYEQCGELRDPRYGNRAKAAQLASEIAGRIGYHPGTARRELAKYLAGRAPAAQALEEPGSAVEEAA
jgi:hypothetical protein